jgi:hypothetical protein
MNIFADHDGVYKWKEFGKEYEEELYKEYIILFNRIEEPTNQDILLINRVDAKKYIDNNGANGKFYGD